MSDEKRSPNVASKDEPTMGRRDFLGLAAGLAGVTVAPGVFLYGVAGAKPDDQAVSDHVRWGMLIDTNQCTEDCNACVTACEEENGWTFSEGSTTDPQWIRKLYVKNPGTGHTVTLPMMCQHCEHPPCVDVCPTGASFRRIDGIVLVDKHICIGCRYCMMACPYKARSLVHEPLTDQKYPRGMGTVESCTLCVHKVDKGDGTTACAEACQRDGHQAILFGDLKDPDSEISKRLKQYGGTQIRADLRLNTGVRYQGI